MIRIDKPDQSPEILTEEGPQRVAEHARELAAGTELEFDRDVYAHPSVVAALLEVQHRKCCYCERLLDRRERDVEHFRPKAAWRQGVNHDIERPGYYWLAYDWANLYLACRACNQEYKGISFPVEGPRASGGGSVDAEVALLVDPGRDEPEAHIDFDGAEICVRANSHRGRTTIRVIELSRAELNHARRRYLEPYRGHVKVACLMHEAKLALTDEIRAEIAEVIASASDSTAPFAGMIRAYLRRQLGAKRMPLSMNELLGYMQGDPLP